MSTPIDLVSSNEAAAMLGLKPISLRIWRLKGKGPRFYKLHSSKQAPVHYSRAEIQSWLAERAFASTSAYPQAGAQ
jgi:hypothetical protein